MQCFVFSCFTACPTKVSQPFTGTSLAPCRGCSVINTLVLQMDTRNGKRLTPTDSCHRMPIHSAGAQPLRRADVVVSTLHLSRSDPGASSQPSREQGKAGVATPCHGPVVSGYGLCEAMARAKQSSGCTGEVLTARPLPCAPGQRGLQARAPARMEGAWPDTSEVSWDGTA